MEPNENKGQECQLEEIERKLLTYKTLLQGIQVNIAELEKMLNDIKKNQSYRNEIKTKEYLEDNKTPEKNLPKDSLKKNIDHLAKFNDNTEESAKEEIIKITDNYKEKLFNYKTFKPKETFRNTVNRGVQDNLNPINKENSLWLKKENINTKFEVKKEEVKVDKKSEQLAIIRLNEEPKNSMIDELFDEDKPIKSKLSDEDELSLENLSNLEEQNEATNFLRKKRISTFKQKTPYNNFLKTKKNYSAQKSYLVKRNLNTEYMKELEEKKEIIDLNLEIISIEEDINEKEFYGLKTTSNKGFISTLKAKKKRKTFKGYLCDICKNYYNVLGENLENRCDKCTKLTTIYKLDPTPQDYYECNI